MASIKELRQRITSVGNIKQITRAMEMVATTKLRRFQDRALASRPYTEEITGLVERLAAVLGEELAERPLFCPGQGEKSLMLVVSSDRGLCGAYNSNLLKSLETEYITLFPKVAMRLKKEGIVPTAIRHRGNVVALTPDAAVEV